MGTAFEMALILKLHSRLASQDIETLEYMTRTEEYSFQTSLDDPFFVRCEEGFGDAWRIIIANNYRSSGEKAISQTLRSIVHNNQLCFRILIDDDTYYNTWLEFSDWLFSISVSDGLVGYLLDINYLRTELIYFERDGVNLRIVENLKVPDSLLHSINALLGGTGCFEL